MKKKITDKDTAASRLKAVDYAVAAQRIEGLTVSPDAVEAMRRAATGEITDAECLALLLAKHKAPAR